MYILQIYICRARFRSGIDRAIDVDTHEDIDKDTYTTIDTDLHIDLNIDVGVDVQM